MRNMSKKTWKLRVWNHMSEAQKLDFLLTKADIPHEFGNRWPNDTTGVGVVVIGSDGSWLWDAVCAEGTYGFKQGLLEVMGKPLLGHDDVEGWLTARQVMKMWRCRNYAAKNR